MPPTPPCGGHPRFLTLNRLVVMVGSTGVDRRSARAATGGVADFGARRRVSGRNGGPMAQPLFARSGLLCSGLLVAVAMAVPLAAQKATPAPAGKPASAAKPWKAPRTA